MFRALLLAPKITIKTTKKNLKAGVKGDKIGEGDEIQLSSNKLLLKKIFYN